ncbi:MAG: FGGY-family carbohydrate kinase [Chloroflexota bacterium]
MNTDAQPPYLLGIDGGTEAIKAGLFDLQGNLVAMGARTYGTTFPRPGWAEQDPAEWWAGLVGAIQDCMAAGQVSPDDVIGLSADATTCTLIPMGADGQTLGNALLWMDVRAASQANQIFATGGEALRYSLAGLSAEWMPPKMLWLKENDLERYEQAVTLLEYTDWIAYRLTGRMTHNVNTITHRWLHHGPSGGWQQAFFEEIGLGDLQQKFSDEILNVGEVVGGLLPDVAQKMGLNPGTPVATGGGDAFIGLLGMGVCEPGDLGVIMGSSNVLAGLAAEEFHVPGIFGSYPNALIPGLNVVEGGQVSTGSILNWFKQNFAQDLASQADADGSSIYQILDGAASQVPVGSDGLIVLDYFQGNRTPYTDSAARGAVWGLSLQSSRAHVFRALMEGIAYGTADIIQTFRQSNFTVERVIACGGATKSPVFMQIYADVLGLPIYIASTPEACLLGSSIVAAVGAGAYPDLVTASQKMAQVDANYQPNAANRQAYGFYITQHQSTYQQLKSLMQAMSHHIDSDA